MSSSFFRIHKRSERFLQQPSSSSSRPLLSASGVEYGVFENGVEDKAPSVLLKYFHRRLHSKRPMDVYRPDVSQSGVRVAISHISVSLAIAFAAFM